MSISVYITSYNQREYLTEAIESVLRQTLAPTQVIIVDDCSSDGSQQVIASYKTQYPDLITPVYHAQNQGVAVTRIDALSAVTSEFVTYLDGDDRYLPTKLEREMALLRNRPDAQIAFSNSYYMTEAGARTGIWVTARNPPEGDVFLETCARDFPRGRLFRMELVSYDAWRRVGFHDPELRLFEDWEMRIRLTKHLRVAFHNEPLSEIRHHQRGLSSLRARERIIAMDHIWQKNNRLLLDMTESDRVYVKRRISALRAEFLRREAKELLGASHHERGSARLAFSVYRNSLRYERCLDFDLLLGLVLPHRLYGWIRRVARQARNSLEAHQLATLSDLNDDDLY